MKHLRLLALSFALAGGCAVSPPDNTFSYHAGSGTVDSVKSARVQIPGGNVPGSAAAGGRVETPLSRVTQPRWVDGYQLALRMDDGTVQAITQDSSAFKAGDRVQVTPEGRVLKLAAATAPSAFHSGSGTVRTVDANGQAVVAMDDGTTQAVVIHGTSVRPGERLTIAADGTVTR